MLSTKNTGLSIIIPIYNEEDSINSTILQISDVIAFSKNIEVILVNDGSTDKTEKILTDIENNNNQVSIIVLHHQQNQGYGSSLKTGIRAAQYEHIAITDADGTYPNNRIMEFYNLAVEKDLGMLVGARLGDNVQIPLIRRPAKWLLNKFANYLTGNEILDLNSGFRIMKKEILNKYIKLLPDGFSFTTTITLVMMTNSYNVEYETINYLARSGKSKIRPIYDTLNFFQLIIRTILYFNPLKIFIPLSLLLLIVGLCFLGIRMYNGGGYGVISTIIIIGSVQIFVAGMLAELINKKLQ
jgi:glycosyltransferase involved in cell wall biosynthesis